jgi:prepilin-type N-terminal cleavage/methylation domain-containing protein
MNPAHEQRPPTRLRRAASKRGFTLVETMVATVLLVMIFLAILQVLVGSYRVAAKARYNDHARYIIKSFADQFLTQQSTDTAGSTLPLFTPTSQTGLGLTWTATAPNGTQTTYPIASPYNNGVPIASGLQVPLSDSSTGEAPIWASVSFAVSYLDQNGNPTLTPNTTAAGSLLVGIFTVTYPYSGRTISQSISAVRATP